jgi:signal peptidase
MRMRTLNRVLTVLIVALFAAWFILLRPSSLGGPVTYVLVNGASMEPTLHTDDIAVVRKQDRYGVGDIVAFRVQSSIVIHRIAGGSADEGFLMLGDNRDAFDPWRPKPDEIVGKMWFSMPAGGGMLAWLRSPLRLATASAALAMLLVLAPAAAQLAQAALRRRPRGRANDVEA